MCFNKLIVLLIFSFSLLVMGCNQGEQVAEEPASDEKPSVQRSSEITLSAVVESVDYEARTFALKDETGSSQSFTVRNPNVPLEKLKAGDNVTMTIYQEEVGFVAAPGEEIPPDAKMSAVGATGAEAEKNITVVNVQQRTSTVEAVDVESRMVTLVDQDGTPLTLPVQDDVKNLDKLKVGDKVVMQTTQVISVEINQ